MTDAPMADTPMAKTQQSLSVKDDATQPMLTDSSRSKATQSRAAQPPAATIETAKNLLVKGIKSSRRGDFKAAIALFTQALHHHPLSHTDQSMTDPVITLKSYYYRGCALSSVGWYEAAITDFSQVIEFSQAAPNPHTAVAVPAKKLTELYIHRGNAYRQLGQQAHAAADLEQGILRSEGSAQSYACRGLLRLDIENFAGAIADFTQALHIHPTFAQCHLWRGFAHLRNHQPSEAEGDLSRAIEAIPDSPEAYNHRGVANVYLCNFEWALADFDQAIRLKPKFAEAYSNRGTLRRALGDIAAAEVDCDRAFALNPSLQNPSLQGASPPPNTSIQHTPHTAYEHYCHGMDHVNHSRFSQALHHFERAIAISPDYTAPYIDRCFTHFLAREPATALEAFERIITHLQLSHLPRPQTHPHQ